MTKNLYYRQVFQRRSILKEFLLDLFLGLSSWPRLLLEVFLRRNLGERYFSLSAAIGIVVFLAGTPIATAFMPSLFGGLFRSQDYRYGESIWETIGRTIADNLLLYLFLAAFVAASLRRLREVQRLPSVFDFGRFSLSSGIIHPLFFSLELGGKPVDVRIIETLLEPALFFALGAVLWLLTDQSLGPVLVVCSVIYSLSYVGAYHKGDHFVMDHIDEMICNEELVHAFVDGQEVDQTRGFRFYGRRPADPATRRQVAETFVEDDDDVVEAK